MDTTDLEPPSHNDVYRAIAVSQGFNPDGTLGQTPLYFVFPLIMQEVEDRPEGERPALYAAFGEAAGIDPETAVQCLQRLVGDRLD